MIRRFLTLLLALCCLSAGALAETWVCPACGNEAVDNFCSQCGYKYENAKLEIFYELALKSSARLYDFSANDEITALYVQDEAIQKQMWQFAAANEDAEKPARALTVYVKRENAESMLSDIETLAGQDLSAAFSYIFPTAAGMLPSIINNTYGEIFLVASSIKPCEELTLLDDMEEGIAIVLLDYGSDKSAMVSTAFYVSPSGAASVDSSYVANADILSKLFKIAEGNISLDTLLGEYGEADDDTAEMINLLETVVQDTVQFQLHE